MTLPGHTVTIGDKTAARGSQGTTSTAFVVGFCEQGRTDRPELVTSPAEVTAKLGARSNESSRLLDSLEVAFREGLTAAYVSRIVGDAAVTATIPLLDGSNAATAQIKAISPGAWGNTLSVQITGSAGAFTAIVKVSGTAVETSPVLASITELIAWASANSTHIVVTDDATSALGPKVQTVTLASGNDDYASSDIDNFNIALARFNRDLGPGQVAAPGFTDAASQAALVAHAVANNRRALIDIADSSDESTLVTVANALRGTNGRQAAAFAPPAIVPGLSPGSTRTVPYSAVQLGLIARAEAAGNSPNRAAAGKLGRAQYAFDLTQHYTDAQRETLNNAGVNVAILKKGVVTTMGNRTLCNAVTDGDWKFFSASRLVMGVAALADTVLDDYEFSEIDGHGHVFAELAGDLAGRACMPFYLSDSLYGTTPEEAFAVNTGPDVNTPASIGRGEIHAQIGIRVSESGEVLSVEIVKVPTTESI